MQNIKKQIIFIFYMICMLFLLNAENNKISKLTSIEYCTITFTSDISTYYSEIKIKKNTRLSLNEFPKLTNSKYKLTGWKYNDEIYINNFIIINDNMQFEAIWEEKTILPADWIQIVVLIVALFGIIFPICFQWRQDQKEKMQIESEKPKLRLLCDETNEGICTRCKFTNGEEHISFKIRVFNDGFTTAKNVQIKMITFDISDFPKIADYDRAIKLNWSYQDQQTRLNLPLEKKSDIQPKSFEDCDFVFFNVTKRLGYFASENSNLLLTNPGTCRVNLIVSGDNILSEEYFMSFNYDPENLKKPIEVISKIQKTNNQG